MQWYTLLPLVALASALTQQEQQAHSQYYGNHRRPCGEAQFSVLSGDAQNYTLRTSAIPQHAAFRTSPFRAAIQELVYNFPRDPVPLDRPLCVPNGVPIGFALDGVPFYSPLSKDWNNAIEGSCAQVYDRCGGNVDRNNQYYYSGLPNFDQSCLDLNRNQDSVHIGTALDGFPIYYERRFNGSALDECGGRYVDTTNKRFYRYVVNNNFPYTIGCFRGRVQNISTLTYCRGHEGEYGSLCTCVNVGPPGMAVGYKWLSKDAVTVGQCMRRPVVGERERALICNRDEIPAPDFLEEDRRSKTCVDFRALYSLIVIQGHRGGLASWTRLWNYGKEEDMEEREEDSEYIRHFKALRWLLSDLDVLDYPALEKFEKNRTKPLCPREQRKLRSTLAQIWVVAFLRDAHKLRPEASEHEKEEAERAFRRLTYVLKTLKAMEVKTFVKRPERKQMDPWGIWTADEEGDDDKEKMKRDEDKIGALVSQLTALQALGQIKEREKKNEKKRDGEDRNKEIRARLLHLLWEIQDLFGDGKSKERGGMRRERGGRGEYSGRAGGEGEDEEEYGGMGRGRPGLEEDNCDEGYEMHEEGMEGMRMGGYGMGRRGRSRRYDGHRSMEGEGGEGMEGGKYHGNSAYPHVKGEGRYFRRGGYRYMEGEGGEGMEGGRYFGNSAYPHVEGEGGEGMEGRYYRNRRQYRYTEGEGGEGMEGGRYFGNSAYPHVEGEGGEGMEGRYYRNRRQYRYTEGEGGEGMEGGRYYGNSAYPHVEGEGGEGMEGRYYRNRGYRYMEGEGGEGMEGGRYLRRGGYRYVEGEGGEGFGMEGDRPQPRGGRGGYGQGKQGTRGSGRYGPPPRGDGGDGQCSVPRDLEQILQLISYLKGARDGGREMPSMGDRRDSDEGRGRRDEHEQREGGDPIY